MGFWHTGYFEHHELYGLSGYEYKPEPPVFRCTQCASEFSTEDALRKHRFETHPLVRPRLFVRGVEIGSHPAKITAKLKVGEIFTECCKHATLNGQDVKPDTIPSMLSRSGNGPYQLVLSNEEVKQTFTLDIRVALSKDLDGIEAQLIKLAKTAILTCLTIEDFIEDTKCYETAIGYCDGICSYLYGILAQEQSPAPSLPREAYIEKFNKAAEQLASYNRPLGNVICGLVDFHFNHFENAVKLAQTGRVVEAASHFLHLLSCNNSEPGNTLETVISSSGLERLLTDWDTEQILRWTVLPANDRQRITQEMEEELKRNLVEFDRLKIHILLAETFKSMGNQIKAVSHARLLRNLNPTEKWAENIINSYSGK